MGTLTKKDLISQTVDRMLLVMLNDVNIPDALLELGIDNICIYGMGKLGQLFYRSLEDTRINVVACVDNNPRVKHPRIKVIASDELCTLFDTIDYYVVTSESHYEQIRDELVGKYSAKTVLLNDLLEEIIFMNSCYL